MQAKRTRHQSIKQIVNRITELQEQKIALMQKKFRETKHELILQEKKAKNNLHQIEEEFTKTKYKRANIKCCDINAWEEDQNHLNILHEKPNLQLDHIKKIQFKSIMQPTAKENFDSIPQLKKLLKRLQSPLKKQVCQGGEQKEYFIKKRNQASKILDLIKFHEPLRDQNSTWNSINHHSNNILVKAAIDQIQKQGFSRTKLQQSEMIRMMRERRHQSREDLFPSEAVTPRKKYLSSKAKKQREKLTLFKLLQ